MTQHIVIVGSGIIGASAAYALSKYDVEITVVDAGHDGATTASFGWINANYFTEEHYFDLRASGIRAYRGLMSELELPVNWQGCLCWEQSGEALQRHTEQLQGMGYGAEIVDAEQMRKMESNLAEVPELAVFYKSEAAAESSQLAGTLLSRAGAKLLKGVAVAGFLDVSGRVAGVKTSAGDFHADQVLVCAGTRTQKLLSTRDVHLPMLDRPGVMVKTKPVKPVLNHILASPEQEFRQCPDGSVLAPAAASHQSDASEEIDNPMNAAKATIDRLNRLISGVDLQLDIARLAYRPVPEDGFPAIGRVGEGLYVATMHSGITLAAVVGQLAAIEIVEGTREKQLSRYRPQRFSEQGKPDQIIGI